MWIITVVNMIAILSCSKPVAALPDAERALCLMRPSFCNVQPEI